MKTYSTIARFSDFVNKILQIFSLQSLDTENLQFYIKGITRHLTTR